MSEAEQLLTVFQGSKAAHGQTILGRVGRNGKTEANSTVVREPLTVDKVQAHIDGKHGVGSIPITQDNMCKFGALDIDTYDLDHKSLNKKILKLKLPLLLCRSKSGGAHLFLFLKDWEPASLVREYLTEMSITLGHSGCEIFPKQDKILADRGDVGNFINMPYFKADLTTRYCLNKDGEAMSLAEFFEAVKKKRISVSELNAFQFAGKREHFVDGPYCLEVISSLGPVSEMRNIFMFAVGVYCRYKWPDDWKKHHEEYNRMLCSPSLDAKEIVQIQESLQKKEYFYQCDVCPLKDHCDKDICKTRPFGVGSSAPDTAELGGLTIMLSEPRLYFMDVNGKRVQLSTEQLQNQLLWQRACMEQIQTMPPTVKPQKWQMLVSLLMDKSTQLEVPEELTLTGQFKELLKTYCTSRIKAMAPEEMEMGKPWTDEGLTRFTIAGLMQFLKNRGFTSYSRAQVQEQIKHLNNGQECFGRYNVRNADGKRIQLRVWWVPSFEENEGETEKEILDDIPF
tara:strand:- start:207 stop:1736 length:1530 start_codon:yes stop_codon:yes gene_type:complete